MDKRHGRLSESVQIIPGSEFFAFAGHMIEPYCAKRSKSGFIGWYQLSPEDHALSGEALDSGYSRINGPEPTKAIISFERTFDDCHWVDSFKLRKDRFLGSLYAGHYSRNGHKYPSLMMVVNTDERGAREMIRRISKGDYLTPPRP